MKLKLGKSKPKKTKTPKLKITKPKPKKTKDSKSLGKRMSKDVKERRKKSSVTFVRPTAKTARRKLEEASEGELWKPRDGLNWIIMLPSTEEMGIGELPWAETKAHFMGGKDAMDALGIERPDDLPMSHGCLKFHQKRPCDWCDFMDKLKKSRHTRDKRLGSALWPGLSCFANIVDLRRPRVVRQFRFGTTIQHDLLVKLDEGYDFTDPDDLMPISIRKTKTGKSDMNVKYSTTVHTDRKDRKGPIKQRWINGMEDLSKFLPIIPTAAEIADAKELLLAASEAEHAEIKDLKPDRDYGGDEDDDDIGF